MKQPALLLDASWYGTLAAARNLGSHGVSVTLGCDSWVAPARWSRHVSHSVSCPSTKDPSLIPWLMAFGARHPGHVLLPTSDETAWIFSAYANELARDFSLFSPPLSSLALLLDKKQLLATASAVGLAVPETVAPRDESEVAACGAELGFPLFVKPRAQLFGLGVGKGRRVECTTALVEAWREHRKHAQYNSVVLPYLSDLDYPIIQRASQNTERIYTVDGFIDKGGELFTTRTCWKVLQLPRGSGPGIVFDHADPDPQINEGIRKLLVATGYRGVFDIEFIESGSKKLLIDVNPRFYNHMAFEIDRGMQLPWLAYLAATGDQDALRGAIESAQRAPTQTGAYVHALPSRMLLAAQRLTHGITTERYRHWRQWIRSHQREITDPAWTRDDPTPRIVEVIHELNKFVRHPRAYLRALQNVPR